MRSESPRRPAHGMTRRQRPIQRLGNSPPLTDRDAPDKASAFTCQCSIRRIPRPGTGRLGRGSCAAAVAANSLARTLFRVLTLGLTGRRGPMGSSLMAPRAFHPARPARLLSSLRMPALKRERPSRRHASHKIQRTAVDPSPRNGQRQMWCGLISRRARSAADQNRAGVEPCRCRAACRSHPDRP